jgi:hypothetical protein
MSERLFAFARRARSSRGWLLASVFGIVALASACTERLEGGGACPVLCPQQQQVFRDTVLEAVAFDTTLGPFPVLGVAGGALLASRGDTVETHVIVRFDALPDFFNPDGVPVTEEITAIDSSRLRFFVDTASTRFTGPFTVEVFDVDTTEADSVASVVRSLFRPDRKIAEVRLGDLPVPDSLTIALPDSFVLARILQRTRLRVGLRIAGQGQLRLGALAGGQPAPRLTFDPASDTTYLPLDVTPSTSFQGAELDDVLRLAYTVYTLTVRGTPPVPADMIAAGGWPSQRAYLRFDVPRAILDSSTVVRAELVLTQVPGAGTDPTRPVGLQPMVGISSNLIRDPYFASALAVNGLIAGVDSIVVMPQDSGPRVLNLVNLVRGWSSFSSDVTRFIALRASGEGAVAQEVRFHGRKAPAELRPRLRITYMPRTEFSLP